MSAKASPQAGQPPGTRSGRPDPRIDEHLGRRLRHRRRQLGLTQNALARSGGLQFQLIQKYECGAAAMSGGRLFQLAALLSVPIDYFFRGLTSSEAGAHVTAGDTAETAMLVRAFAALPEERRRRLAELVKEMADDGNSRAALGFSPRVPI